MPEAVAAWNCLQGGTSAPTAITVLKPDSRKSAVYRLEGLRPDGSAVIVKHCAASTARTERVIYEEILPALSVPSLRCLGWLDDPDDPRFAWLFLEDAGDVHFNAGSEEHRRLAGGWLGFLHLRSASGAQPAALPYRGLDWHRAQIRDARRVLLEGLDNSVLVPSQRALLEVLVGHCDTIEARWSEIEEFCRSAPLTLVHGDFGEKNIRVRREAGASWRLFPLDWEQAAWGVPAADLSRVDPDAYWAVAQPVWPGWTPREFRRYVNFGVLFWCLNPIRGERSSLCASWVDRVMGKLEVYRQEIDSAVKAVGWSRSA